MPRPRWMLCHVCFYQKQNGGMAVSLSADRRRQTSSLDRLEHSVCEAGVLFGIDHERLQQLADSPEYFQLSVVAYGLAPIPGDDGRIVELVPREPPQTAPQEGAQGLVDYRSSSYTNIIHEGDVICDITSSFSRNKRSG